MRRTRPDGQSASSPETRAILPGKHADIAWTAVLAPHGKHNYLAPAATRRYPPFQVRVMSRPPFNSERLCLWPADRLTGGQPPNTRGFNQARPADTRIRADCAPEIVPRSQARRRVGLGSRLVSPGLRTPPSSDEFVLPLAVSAFFGNLLGTRDQPSPEPWGRQMNTAIPNPQKVPVGIPLDCRENRHFKLLANERRAYRCHGSGRSPCS